MKKVLILSTGKYPNGNAGAVRQHAFAKLLQCCGYFPFVIGLGDSTNFRDKEYEGVTYTSFRAQNNNILNRVFNLLLFKARLKKFLETNSGFSKIIVVSIPTNALLFLKRYAKKNGVELIHDSVEWYSPEEFTLGHLSPSYIVNNLYNTRWIDKNFKVIAISKYLQSHYLSRRISTTRIPVIMDVHNAAYKKRVNPDKLLLVYAGSVGKKDYLREIIEGLSLLTKSDLLKVELRLFGVDYNQLRRDVGVPINVLEKVNSSLNCFGRVSREVVLDNLEQADFTVLLRPASQRYAKAGFPTKIVESLSSGTPVICNITSDLGDYIYEGKNGIIVHECTATSFSQSLVKALKLTYNEKVIMQNNARKTATENFDYRIYANELENLFK